LKKEGFVPFEKPYYNYWLHSDQHVMLIKEGGTVDVVIKGLTSSGFLKAVNTNTQQIYELYPDGNSFDIMKGLIQNKS